MKFIVAIDLYYLLKLFIAGFDLNMDRRRRVFVTVGTTSFDKLIQTVSDITTLQVKGCYPLRNNNRLISSTGLSTFMMWY